jgi:hypothetical protein
MAVEAMFSVKAVTVNAISSKLRYSDRGVRVRAITRPTKPARAICLLIRAILLNTGNPGFIRA